MIGNIYILVFEFDFRNLSVFRVVIINGKKFIKFGLFLKVSLFFKVGLFWNCGLCKFLFK